MREREKKRVSNYRRERVVRRKEREMVSSNRRLARSFLDSGFFWFSSFFFSSLFFFLSVRTSIHIK